MRSELPSNAYFVFQNVITLLDFNGTSNLSDGEFLDGQYKASRANYANDSAARCAASFLRELPSLFGRVEPSSVGGHPASTHPLLSIHDYRRFNAADNLSGVKQRIIGKMTTTVSRIKALISQRLAGSSFWRWFRSSKGINLRGNLTTWLEGGNKYVWKRVGKVIYQRNLKLLQDRSSDLMVARDCIKRVFGSS